MIFKRLAIENENAVLMLSITRVNKFHSHNSFPFNVAKCHNWNLFGRLFFFRCSRCCFQCTEQIEHLLEVINKVMAAGVTDDLFSASDKHQIIDDWCRYGNTSDDTLSPFVPSAISFSLSLSICRYLYFDRRPNKKKITDIFAAAATTYGPSFCWDAIETHTLCSAPLPTERSASATGSGIICWAASTWTGCSRGRTVCWRKWRMCFWPSTRAYRKCIANRLSAMSSMCTGASTFTPHSRSATRNGEFLWRQNIFSNSFTLISG